MAQLAPPRFEDHGPMVIVGHIRRHTPESLSRVTTQWFEMQSQLALITGAVGGDAFGVWWDLLSGGNRFTYLAGVRVGEFAPTPPSLSIARLIPLHYAIFTHQGPHLEVRRTIDAVLSQWLPNSGRERSVGSGEPDVLEHYSAQFNETGSGPIEVWLPIKK